MAEGFDPQVERDRREITVDEDLGKGETRRLYVKVATQDGQLQAVSLEAAPGSFLTWKDVETALPKHARKLVRGGKG